MSAPRGFIVDEAMVQRAARALCKQHAKECGTDEGDTWMIYYEMFYVSARLALAAAQGDAPTTPEPLPPLVRQAYNALETALRMAVWPDDVRAKMPTEEARALLAWLDRGRP